MTEPVTQAFHIAVVGILNEGKTSVIRTLIEDPNFGEVANRPGVTPERTPKKVVKHGESLFFWDDCPGFGYSGQIIEHWEDDEDQPLDHIEVKNILDYIHRKKQEGTGDWNMEKETWETFQDPKVLVALFIVNITNSANRPNMEESLRLLARCRKPVIGVFNFLPKDGQPSNLAEYEKLFDKYNVTHCCFDCHRRDFGNQTELLEQISMKLKPNSKEREKLGEYILWLKNEENRRLQSARDAIADLLFALASYRKEQRNVAKKDVKKVCDVLHKGFPEKIFTRCRETSGAILAAWKYTDDHTKNDNFQCSTAEKDKDHRLGKNSGKHGMTGAGIGAAVGLIVDVFALGLTGGLGTIVGATLGGLLGGGLALAINPIYDEKLKIASIQLEPKSINDIYQRMVYLTNEIRCRGKAIEDKTLLDMAEKLIEKSPTLPDDLLRRLAQYGLDHPTDTLTKDGRKPGYGSNDTVRDQECDALRRDLIKQLNQSIPGKY